MVAAGCYYYYDRWYYLLGRLFQIQNPNDDDVIEPSLFPYLSKKATTKSIETALDIKAKNTMVD
jgi:hypothetical protein